MSIQNLKLYQMIAQEITTTKDEMQDKIGLLELLLFVHGYAIQ